jgi:hypothetical protein
MRIAALLAAASCVLLGCGNTNRGHSDRSARLGQSGRWAGLGARLADWESAHPRGKGSGLEGCTREGCFGARLKLGTQTTYEFTSVQKTSAQGRIYGYEQGLPAGTPLEAAKARVLALFPRDAKTQGFRVFHAVERSYDPLGDSCAIWNLKSHALGLLLVDTDPSGEISVILSRNDVYYLPRFEPANVTNAIVATQALAGHDGC